MADNNNINIDFNIHSYKEKVMDKFYLKINDKSLLLWYDNKNIT